jgi:hypothetical protein
MYITLCIMITIRTNRNLCSLEYLTIKAAALSAVDIDFILAQPLAFRVNDYILDSNGRRDARDRETEVDARRDFIG